MKRSGASMEYRVEITEKAFLDGENAYNWIAERSQETATEWYVGLIDAIGALRQFPARCPVIPETDVFDEEIRQLLYGKARAMYRILFTIVGDRVVVLRILQTAQDITSKL